MRTTPSLLAVASLALAGHALVAGCSCDGPDGRTRDAGRGGGVDVGPFDAPGLDIGSLPGEDAGIRPADVVIIVPGTPDDAPTHFDDPDESAADAAPSILYPLDQVLFPRNVWSPDVQWDDPGVAGDVYRVRFSAPPVTVTAYLAHPGDGFAWDYIVPYPSWRLLTNAAAGSAMTITVDRWIASSHTVAHGTSIEARVSAEGIAGAVYYWTLGAFSGTEGRIVRVRQGVEVEPMVENFMPSPPIDSGGDRCAACHGLSRDGNHLAASLGDGEFGGVFDLTADLTGADPPMLFRFSQPWFFAAFSPDGSRVLMTDPSQGTHVLDGASGAEITTLRDGTHPAWSPDGSQLALVVGADDAWNPTVGDLATIPVTGADTFGAAGSVHRGADLSGAPEGGALDAYPTFSPDGRYLAFQHGTRTLLSAGGARGALYLVPASGGAAVRLDHASAGDAYYPNFTPFMTNRDELTSVYWVLHYSPRDYGNAHAGTRGTHRRQIWVSAVSSDAPGEDPSAVPYWLPGQDVSEENASAYWAPLPCRNTGAACGGDGDCCTGHCGPNATLPMACLPPPECRREGDSCEASADCCAPELICVGGACVVTLI